MYIANVCNYVMKTALLTSKTVYIDNFNAFSRQTRDSFINRYQN